LELRGDELTKFILNRLYQSVFVIFGVITVVFIVMQFAGDPVQLYLPPSTPDDMIDEYREEMGLNDPVFKQYIDFLSGVVKGDFGESMYYHESAMGLVLERFPATLGLTIMAMAIALLIGVPAGIISAVNRNSKFDFLIRVLAFIGQCTPQFWLGIVLILIFSVNLGLMPTSGSGSFAHILLPSVSLGLFVAATITRLLRSGMIEVMHQEYITVAKAKGLRRNALILRHALKNAMSSVITILGLQFAGLLGGSVIIETVFSWPGIGSLVIDSIYNRDFAVVQAVVVLAAVTFVLINLIVDILYSTINPRVKY